MSMWIWQDGDGDTLEGCSRSPSILIPLCTLNAPRNTSSLNLDHGTRVEEVEDVDMGK